MGTCMRLCSVIGYVAVSLILGICHGKVHHKVKCTDDTMIVEIVKTEDMGDIYLEHLKYYPDAACHPEIEENKVTFRLSLADVYQCGVTRISNRLTGLKTYYHRVVVEKTEPYMPKDVIITKCVLSSPSHILRRRNLLPADFKEDDDVETTTTLEELAPDPLLKVGVRQGGQLVTGELNVNPGTPLQMEIYLDNNSAPIYGLLVSYMQVSDTKNQEETIIFNGCSVDPYLFENFNTVDGDFLAAKFRAFKFPDSTYVLFKGTVNVCLDKCEGVDCSNGQKGYGRRRRRREIKPHRTYGPNNKMFEVTMTTFIKVDYIDDTLLEKGKYGGSLILPKNKRNETHVTGATIEAGNSLTEDHMNHHLKLATEEVHEELQYTVIEGSASSSISHFGTSLLVVCMSLILLWK